MKHLNTAQCNQISGGENGDAWFHIVMTPDEFNAKNLIGLSVFGGGMVGAFGLGSTYWTAKGPALGIAAGVAGMAAGAVVGGAASATFLSITQPIFNYINERFA